MGHVAINGCELGGGGGHWASLSPVLVGGTETLKHPGPPTTASDDAAGKGEWDCYKTDSPGKGGALLLQREHPRDPQALMLVSHCGCSSELLKTFVGGLNSLPGVQL